MPDPVETPAMASSSFTVRSPDPFTFSNPAEWPRWQRRFERFRIASKLEKASEKEQINTLIYLMGDQADNIFLSFPLSPTNKDKYAEVMKAFTNHFVVKTNVIYERAKFNLRSQLEGELIEDFITDLYTLSENCKYGTLRDEMIRDKIVVGVRDRKLSEKLQLVTDLTLEKAITEVRQHQAVRKQQVDLTNSSVHKLSAEANTQKNRSTNRNMGRKGQSKCIWCGSQYVHVNQNNCPAKGKRCNKCKKMNHFASVCKSSEAKSKTKVNQLNTSIHDLPSGKAEFLGMLSVNNINECRSWKVEIYVNEGNINFMIDTGSPIDAISYETYRHTFAKTKLHKSDKAISGPDGKSLVVKGMFQADMKFQQNEIKSNIYVIDGLQKHLLSLNTSIRLGLITKNTISYIGGEVGTQVEAQKSSVDIEKEFPSLFNALGCLKDFKCNIKLRNDAKPFQVFTARRVPVALRNVLKSKLNEMVKMGVIKEVDEPTPWCSPMVITTKSNGDIRICVDLTKLNAFVEREIHPMPVADHTLAQLAGAKIFSKLDANSGFWQVKLDDASQLLTTFLTPFGRYCFLRMPFGITSAPEIYQKRMQHILRDIKGAVCQMDDILVFGSDAKSHDEILRIVLSRLQENGASLNRDKCEIGTSSLKFLGHVVDASGIRPSSSRIAAIENYPTPTTVTELKRFLGMVNFLGKFIPLLSDWAQSLNELLRSTTEFRWGNSQETSFRQLKKMLTQSPVLKLYDPSHKTILSTDASSYGLGAVLLQIDEGDTLRPVAYASRSLSPAERGYAQIEKEALAITWAAVVKFPELLTGIKFSIETDHKPLIPIFTSKNLDELTPRLQRFRMRMMKYQFEIYYTAGKFLVAADALSRHPVEEGIAADDCCLEEDARTYVNSVVASLPMTQGKLNIYECSQKKDGILQKVVKYCLEGWPDRYRIESQVRPYYNERQSLSLNNDLLMHGCRVVVPAELRQEVLEKIHAGHLGIVKCKTRAQQSVWWPGCGKDIENHIKKCSICIQNTVPRHESLMSSATPERPWQMVGTDLFFHKSNSYIIVSDYFSRYPEIAKLENQTTSCVINHLKSIFCRHGIPEIVRSDNGPQFQRINQSAFAMFAKQWGFQHITSSPRYPQSNGFIESSVKTIKALLKKNKDPYLALMEYRATPLANGFSPAEMLMGRKIRTTLPIIDQQLTPNYNLDKQIDNDRKLKSKQANNYNKRHAITQREQFEVGDVVWIRDLNSWGRIKQRAETPRSYIVSTNNGDFRRNSFHLVSARRKDVPYEPGEVREIPITSTQGAAELSETENLSSNEADAPTTASPSSIPRYVTTTKSGRIIKQPDRYQT